ncbi:Trehalose synthase [Candidatus Bilamarchaeum dharawalense]|uniref:Trehalose synthase n=1 Tax=Candidatus Bilamarchaeum dharawalense TaxID=2885759 RepID=A0A5E4LRR4_9ARCH|nr:Trehalose synthase [Candidatus Bilamarchaeum dharawalense]
MKIALFTDTYLPQLNGVAVYLGDAIIELTKRNNVILFAPGEGPLRVEQKSENFKIYWIPSAPFPFYDGYRVATMDYKKISAILKKEAPEIVHAHAPINLGLQGLLAAKRRRIPTVVTYHTHFPEYVPHLLKGKLPKVFDHLSQTAVKKMIKYVFRKVDVVTAPTEELVRELRSYGLNNVTYLPNGIDFNKLKCEPKRIEHFRKQNNIPRNKKTIVYLGRISFEKKLDQVLRAFKEIENRDRMLLVVGGGPYIKNFKGLADELGIKNIIFTGFVKSESVGAAYSCGDIFVSASDTETFGLTFVEGMYMGLPAIGVNRLGAKEVISDGKTGLLVEPGDVKELASAMDRLLEDNKLRKKMATAAKKRAEAYSIENSVKGTLNVYKQIITKTGRKISGQKT